MGFAIFDEPYNASYYYLLTNVSDSSMSQCYLQIGKDLDNKTEYAYSEAVSLIGGLGAEIIGMIGFTLNLFVIIALTKTPGLRKEYLTPFMISLSLTDFLFSAIPLPMTAVRYFLRYVFIYVELNR